MKKLSIFALFALALFNSISSFAKEKEEIIQTIKHFHDELTRYSTSYNHENLLNYFAAHGKINITRTDMDTVHSDLHEIDYYLHRMEGFHSIFAKQKDMHFYSIRTQKSEKEVVTVVNYFTKFAIKLDDHRLYKGEHYCTALLKREGDRWKIFRLFVIDIEKPEEKKDCTAEFFIDDENPEEVISKVVIPYDHGTEEELNDFTVTVFEGQRWIMVNELSFKWNRDDHLLQVDLDNHVINDFGFAHTEEGAAFTILKNEMYKNKCINMELAVSHLAQVTEEEMEDTESDYEYEYEADYDTADEEIDEMEFEEELTPDETH